MRRNQTNNKNKGPVKKKQKLDGSDLLIESRLVVIDPVLSWREQGDALIEIEREGPCVTLGASLLSFDPDFTNPSF
jgi:hypothetical protein